MKLDMRPVCTLPVGSVVREPGGVTEWSLIGRSGAGVVLDAADRRLWLGGTSQVVVLSTPSLLDDRAGAVVTPDEAVALAVEAVQAVRDGRGAELPDEVRHVVQASYLDGPSDAVDRRARIVARRLGWLSAVALLVSLVVPGMVPGRAAPAAPTAVPDGSSTVVPPAAVEESTPDPLAGAVAGDCASWHPALLAAGWTDDQLDTLDRIAWIETRCGVDLLNDRSGDAGLLQLNPVHCRWLAAEGIPVDCRARRRDRVRVLADEPMLGIRAARLLWERCGWGPWGPDLGRRYSCRRPR